MITIEQENLALEVKDLGQLEKMRLAARAPDRFVESAEDANGPEDIDVDFSPDLVDYMVDVLTTTTDLEEADLNGISNDNTARIFEKVMNEVYGDGADSNERDQKQLKRVKLTREYINALFRGDVALIGGMPDDATLQNFHYDPATDSFQFVFSSDEWKELHEGEEIPFHESFVVQRGYDELKDL